MKKRVLYSLIREKANTRDDFFTRWMAADSVAFYKASGWTRDAIINHIADFYNRLNGEIMEQAEEYIGAGGKRAVEQYIADNVSAATISSNPVFDVPPLSAADIHSTAERIIGHRLEMG